MCYCVEEINPTKLTKARKDYEDSNKWFILEVLTDLRRGQFGKVKFSEWRLIATAIMNRWKILKGQLHECGTYKMDDHIYQFRTMPGLSEICHRLELYPEC